MSEVWQKEEVGIRVHEVKEHYLEWQCWYCGMKGHQEITGSEEINVLKCWNCGRQIIKKGGETWKEAPEPKK